MGEKLIRKVTCDRCGKSCSSYTERTIGIDDGVEKIFMNNSYSYTKMILQGFDSRFECQKSETVLCNECLNKLGEWLKVK